MKMAGSRQAFTSSEVMKTRREKTENLRSLPRVFVERAKLGETVWLPRDELVKLRKVLRLSSGSLIAVLPNDGSLLKCILTGTEAEPVEQIWPNTEAQIHLTVAQALPKGDKLEEILRACTELGVSRF